MEGNPKWKTIEGSLTLKGGEHSITVAVHGQRVPDSPKEIGEYVGTKVMEAVSGVTSSEMKAKEQQVAELRKLNSKLEGELAEAKEQITALRKAK